jgi:hypothetical protein
MARYLGKHPIGFDQRTGKKQRYSDLVEDGEIPGLRVKRGTEDLEHPQKRLRRIGPDLQALWRPAPEVRIAGETVNIGLEASLSNLAGGRLTVPDLALSRPRAQLVFELITDLFGYNEDGYNSGGYGGITSAEAQTVDI